MINRTQSLTQLVQEPVEAADGHSGEAGLIDWEDELAMVPPLWLTRMGSYRRRPVCNRITT